MNSPHAPNSGCRGTIATRRRERCTEHRHDRQRPRTKSQRPPKTSGDPGWLGYRPQASVMQRQRQAGPWAQAARREPQCARRRIPKEALDAGPSVVRVEIWDQYLARVGDVLRVESGAATARQCQDLTFLGEHLAEGVSWAVLMHVGHSV